MLRAIRGFLHTATHEEREVVFANAPDWFVHPIQKATTQINDDQWRALPGERHILIEIVPCTFTVHTEEHRGKMYWTVQPTRLGISMDGFQLIYQVTPQGRGVAPAKRGPQTPDLKIQVNYEVIDLGVARLAKDQIQILFEKVAQVRPRVKCPWLGVNEVLQSARARTLARAAKPRPHRRKQS